MLKGTLVIEVVNNSFKESKQGTFKSKKIGIWTVHNIFSLDFPKYLYYAQLQKSIKVGNV